jgi:glycosyl hydrolase family 2
LDDTGADGADGKVGTGLSNGRFGTPLGDAGVVTSCPATGLAGVGRVQIAGSGTSFTMMRDGAPYYIKGIAGGANLNMAGQYGVNSIRTFNSNAAMETLDVAASHCMTVLLGIGLSKMPPDYTNATYLDAKRAEVTNLLATVKDHPALLMWALGNEIQLGTGNDNQTSVGFIQELAQLIHQQDPNHPVITAIAGANTTFINHLVQWAPALNAIGVNTYAAVVTVNADVARSTFTGAIIVTEWGPTGHWESPNTAWARPIEETSGVKGRVYKTRYDSFAHTGRILGDYVFLWGQKVERTPTWYGMFLETDADLGIAGESLPTVETMALEWAGSYPINRAPDVTALTLGGRAASASVTLTAGQAVQALVTATEPDGDAMSYVWEILEDPAQPDLMGMAEAREPRVGTPQMGTVPMLNVTAPTVAGQYRLFVYVLDGKGHAGTANIPFRVN